MKTRITLIALLLISSITGLKAQDVEQAKDTTKITIKGKKIIIIDSDSTNVWIGDDADDDQHNEKHHDQRHDHNDTGHEEYHDNKYHDRRQW